MTSRPVAATFAAAVVAAAALSSAACSSTASTSAPNPAASASLASAAASRSAAAAAAASALASAEASPSSEMCTTHACIVHDLQSNLVGLIAQDESVTTKAVCYKSTVVYHAAADTYSATCVVTYSDGSTATGTGNLLVSQQKVTFEPTG